MSRAIALAGRARGRVAPNPLVGCVVVREGRVVGEGWHREFGAPHAERMALRAAGRDAEGATLYVSLEPCTHHGKTPPCTQAILESGIRRVVVGCRDPDDRATGGMEELRRAGVRVELGPGGMEAARLNAPFLWWRLRGRPFVSLKLALSIDARIARAEGERTRLTGPEALRHAHRLRAEHGAVLVGRRTVEVDDPRLTARGEAEPRVPPVRVVLDRRLRTPLSARLVETAGDPPTWIFCGPESDARRRRALESAGVEVLPVESGAGDGVELEPVLERLGERGIRSVLVEGGGRVAASFLQRPACERLHLLVAPLRLGPAGVPAFPGGPGPRPPGEPERWVGTEVRRLGRDVLQVFESGPLQRALAEVVEVSEVAEPIGAAEDAGRDR